MRKCIYLITVSTDGYIATEEGTTEWMSGAPRVDYGFHEFYQSISTIVMGRITFNHLYELSKDFFPYEDKEVIVASHRELPAFGHGEVLRESDDIVKRVAAEKIANKPGDIWIAGGAALATVLFEAGLIDEVRLFIQPIVLGSGISFFKKLVKPRALRVEHVENWSGGVVEVRYLTVKSWHVDI